MANLMENKTSTTIYIIRHGSTEHNEKQIFQGHSDVSGNYLSDAGRAEVLNYLKPFEGVNIDVIFSSDLSRARQTAEIFAASLKKDIDVSPLLRGKKMGQFEGVKVSEYREKNKTALERFKTLPEIMQWRHRVAEDVESNEEVLNRLMLFLRETVHEHKGRNILIVTHGGAIRNLLFFFGWAKQHELLAGSIENGGYIKLIHDDEGLKLADVAKVNPKRKIG